MSTPMWCLTTIVRTTSIARSRESTTTAAPHSASPEADSPASANSPPAASAPMASSASSWLRCSTRSRRCRRHRAGAAPAPALAAPARGAISAFTKPSVRPKHRAEHPGGAPSPISGIPGWMPPLPGLLWTGDVRASRGDRKSPARRGRAFDRRAVRAGAGPQRLRNHDRAHGQRGAASSRGRPTRRRAARSHAARRRRSRRVPRAAPHLHGPDHHADGPRNRDRPRRGTRARCRRLRRQAVRHRAR